MGQYYMVVNLDKKEYLHPHKFGDGLKLLEFGASASGTMCGLAVLLAEGNNRGGGDLRSDNPVIGSWARDRIVVAGDYADEEPGRYLDGHPANLYALLDTDGYKDISDDVARALCDDAYIAAHFAESIFRWRPEKLPDDLRARLQEIHERKEKGRLGGREEEPVHVRLARAVLRASDDEVSWNALLDACIEFRDAPHKSARTPEVSP